MRSTGCRSLIALAIGATSLWACDCGLLPVCAYRGADVVFLGRVSFSNHDDSAGLNQATLVRFDVEESFKGVEPKVRQIWVDPGSFTSCYQVYQPDERYLIFGSVLPAFPGQAKAMTIGAAGAGKGKPLPRDFDTSNPPPVYYSPECAGSRRADRTPGFQQDVAMLRAYRAGEPLPNVLGHVHLSPFSGWPWLDGPAPSGVAITLSSDAARLKTSTDRTGRFSIQDAPPGDYKVQADLAPYRMDPEPTRFPTTDAVNGHLHVPASGCGYTEVQLATASTINGMVLDPQGKGAARIPVLVRMKDAPPRTHALFAVTDSDGRFTISGVPDADVYLSAGVDNDFFSGGSSPNVDLDMRYRAVYFPGGSTVDAASPLRVRLGERRSLVLRLGTPLKWTRVVVKVVDKDGRPKVGAFVSLLGGPPGSESKTAGAYGLASIQCLAGWKYELHARAIGGNRLAGGRPEIAESSPTLLACGQSKRPAVLILDQLGFR